MRQIIFCKFPNSGAVRSKYSSVHRPDFGALYRGVWENPRIAWFSLGADMRGINMLNIGYISMT